MLRRKTAAKQPEFKQPLRNLSEKLYRVRSLLLLLLLFSFSMTVPFFRPQVSISTPIVQNQSNTIQLLEQGQKLYQVGQFQDAVIVWQQAAGTFAARGDVLNQAMALSNLSLTYQQLGQWNEAKNAIAQSFSLLQTQGKTPIQKRIFAATLDIEGQLQLGLGELAHALKSWQQAADIYKNIGDHDAAIQSLINQAQAMQELGFYPRACNTLRAALGINSQNCQVSAQELQLMPENLPVSLKILGLRSLGNVLRVIGQTKQSQMVLLKSWQLAQTPEDFENLAAIALSLGNTARFLGNQNIPRGEKQPPVASIKPVTCFSGEN